MPVVNIQNGSPTGPAIELVQQKAFSQQDGSSPVAVMFDAPITAGNMVLVQIAFDPSKATFSTPPNMVDGDMGSLTAGAINEAANNLWMYSYWISCGGVGETGITFTLDTAVPVAVNASEWNGLVGSGPENTKTGDGSSDAPVSSDLAPASPTNLCIISYATSAELYDATPAGFTRMTPAGVGGAEITDDYSGEDGNWIAPEGISTARVQLQGTGGRGGAGNGGGGAGGGYQAGTVPVIPAGSYAFQSDNRSTFATGDADLTMEAASGGNGVPGALGAGGTPGTNGTPGTLVTDVIDNVGGSGAPGGFGGINPGAGGGAAGATGDGAAGSVGNGGAGNDPGGDGGDAPDTPGETPGGGGAGGPEGAAGGEPRVSITYTPVGIWLETAYQIKNDTNSISPEWTLTEAAPWTSIGCVFGH